MAAAAILIYSKAKMETARDSLEFDSRHIQIHFLRFSAFCIFFHLIMPKYLILLDYIINDCGIANMLWSLRRVLQPPKNAKLSEIVKTLSFMR